MDGINADISRTPAEAFLAELGGGDHTMVIDVFKVVAGYQGLTDWHMAQWQNITSEDLPPMLAQLRARFTEPDAVMRAVAVIKGVTRCAWRQKLMTGQQLSEVARWKA